MNINKSLVLPLYNAGKFIESKAKDYKYLLEWGGQSLQIIFVCDGCNDNSEEIINELFKIDPRVNIISYPKNRGKGFALRKGFSHAIGKYIVFTDVDLAYPPEEVIKIFKHLQSGKEFVVANRRDPESVFEISPRMFRYVFTRHILSNYFNKLINFLLGLKCPDTQAGLKGFHRDQYNRISEQLTSDGFIFDLELILLLAKNGIFPNPIGVRWIYKEDESTVNLYKHGFKMVMETLKLRWKYTGLKRTR